MAIIIPKFLEFCTILLFIIHYASCASVGIDGGDDEKLSTVEQGKLSTSGAFINNSNKSSLKLRSSRQEGNECDGFNDVVEDIGLLTYLLDVLISFAGIALLFPAYFSQIYAYISGYKIALPSLLLYVIDDGVQLLETVEEYFDRFGLIDTIFNLMVNVPFNDFVNLVSGVVELVGISNLFVENLGTFPDFMEFFFKNFLGIDAREYFNDYGCNPKEFNNNN